MVIACCAVGCTNRQGCKQNLSFYRIPLDKDRRRRWIATINRKNWQPSKYSRICSEHFVQGKKSEDPLSPDYVPSIFAHTKSPAKRRAQDIVKKYDLRQKLKKKKLQMSSRNEAARTLLSLSTTVPEFEEDTENAVAVCDNISNEIMCQTSLSGEDIEILQQECQLLRSETFELKEKLDLDFFQQKSLENLDKLKTLTGLHSYDVFMAIFDLVKPFLKDTPHLTGFQQLLITIMRLKENLTASFLSYLFGVHTSTVSRVFTYVINVLNEILVPACVLWPKREHVQTSMPMCFRKSFKHCMSVIDCFEIFIDKPKDLKARAQTYSQYKSHNTMKYLISITPQGVISFISKGWGGRSTDAHITANSGFLDHLQPGDVVLADRGFTIQNQVGLYCAKVEIPAFTRGKKQLGAAELEDTRRLAAVRIHVERVIGQARSKYKMLKGPVPISLLSTDDTDYTTLDKIVRVACALTNLCPSVVPTD
ncbi:uncharacterized protein LOC127533698 [Acanthochromis polyacanthus]|uniref:uncharacterized protein LOC127533698 n=1 Tax=Acanthochromis polyacanthus TaxID=80966 RepID=UPI0022340B62|nr:uncharacterized protein LOC127533698 [Acanthochromis polyacanthus]